MTKKIGFIGCGSVVQKNYLMAFQKLRKFDNEFLFFDLNNNSALLMAEKFKGQAANNQQDLISKSDIIIVATPPSTHFEIVSEALKNGKEVLCEKPFMCTSSEASEILSLQKKYNKKLYVGHFRRTFAHVLKANELVKTGVLGDVKKIRLFEGGRFNWVAESNYITKDLYGGVLFDTGSHTFDTALFISNLDKTKILKLDNMLVKKDENEPSHEIKGNFNLTTEDGNKIDFEFMLSRFKVLSNKIEIICDNGKLIISTGLNSKIILEGRGISSCIVAENSFDDYMDYFAKQIEEILLAGEKSDKFCADRFYNLTFILESIAKTNGVEK
ncbi:MAG: Gfo/Idh/MocA family protein [Stygiobacter sp.]